MHNATHCTDRPTVHPVTTAEELAEIADRLAPQTVIGLDTEFLRERTYHAQLCLLQLAWTGAAVCVDPLAVTDLAALRATLSAPPALKVLHAARQDLEVLLPAVGPVRPLFDTQIAAALAGESAQIGYAELVRRLLGVELAKAHTRTDWSRRPLSAEQIEYALDDVRHLLALKEALQERLERLGRLSWLAEELAALEDPAALTVEPEQAWRRLKGLSGIDPGRQRLLCALAAWRERRALERNRPRGWILEDGLVREIVLRVPRTLPALGALPGMPAGLIERCGAQILAHVQAARIPDPPPPLSRPRPDPLRNAQLKRLGAALRDTAAELGLSPEVLATRRDLEQLAEGRDDSPVLRGWRRAVLAERLLAAR
jgi:ribonuclease D